MILLPEWLHMLNYVKTFFSYPSTPPPLKSFKINMFNMLGFQNLPKHPKLQSASIGSRCSSSKGFFLSGFHLWFLAFCTNMREEFVVRFPLAHVALSDCVV
jgi:hypothetical protein